MDSLRQDLRFALRTLGNARGFAAIAVLCLALGIGVNTTIFSIFDCVFLRPLPFTDASRLVSVLEIWPGNEEGEDEISYPNFVDWTSDRALFARTAAHEGVSFNLADAELPEYVEGQRVSTTLFSVLGVRPVLGRDFRPEEGTPGRERVALLAHTLWQRRFAGSPDVVGRTLALNGEPYTIIGVMPDGFRFPETSEIWVPHALSATANRGNHSLRTVARLASGVSVAQANAAIAPVTRRLQQQYPESNARLEARVVAYRDVLMPREVRGVVAIMLGAVSFVLLIACANVANLLLARATGRQREMAVRTALGAGRGRIVRQLLTESAIVGVLGGALGALLAYWGLDLVMLGITEPLPYYIRFAIDGRALAFTMAVALLTGLLFGLAPALRASRPNLHEDLKDGGRGAGDARRGRLRSTLVVAELALSVVLLVGAMLMVRSFMALQGQNPGFDPTGTLTLRVSLAGERYTPIAKRVALADQALRGIASLPAVETAALTSYAPLSGSNMSTTLEIEGRPYPAGEAPGAAWRPVSADYFTVLRIPLLRGRAFTAREVSDSAAAAVIVNETVARTLFSGEEALGRRIRAAGDGTWLTIVGVVPEVKQRRMDSRDDRQIFFPYASSATRSVTFLVRARGGDPAALTAAVQREIRRADPSLATYRVMTLERLVAQSFWDRRLYGMMFGGFALIALVLAGVGVYGVMSYSVAQRTREIGVRMALGAQVGDVLRLVVGKGLALAAIGIVAGIAGAFGLTRVLAGFLFGVSATDPLTFLAIPLFLGGIALLASYLPARRAARVDPTVSLRYE